MLIHSILILVIFFNISLSIFIFTQNPKSPSNRIFSVIGLVAAIWTFTNYMADISNVAFWLESTYAFGSIIIYLGLIWSLVITGNKLNYKNNILLTVLTIVFFIGSYQEGFIVLDKHEVYKGIIFMGGHGWGLTMYTVYYLISSFCMLWIILRARNKTTITNYKNQLKYISIGMIISLTIIAFSSFILPLFSIFLFAGIDNIGFLFFLIFVTYSITKYNFFNTQIILVEFVVFILWLLIVVHISISDQYEKLMSGIGSLLIAIILGIILVRNTLHTINQDRKIDELTEELSRSYSKIKNLLNE